MNSQTPETDAFLERHRQHNEDEMESTVEMLKRMECQRNAAVEALRTLDRQMIGNEIYEHAWANHPKTPEESPAALVRKAISERQKCWRLCQREKAMNTQSNSAAGSSCPATSWSPFWYGVGAFFVAPVAAIFCVLMGAMIILAWPFIPFLCYMQKKEEITKANTQAHPPA